MDPGHHTAFLLAILVCILLLVLAVSAMLACYMRKKCFGFPNWISTKGMKGLTKDQSTSMSGFTLTMPNHKKWSSSRSTSQTLVSIPSLDVNSENEKRMTSCLTNEEFTQASELGKMSIGTQNSSTDKYSSLHCMLSSGASVFSSMLEMGSMLGMKGGRRSSSMKSGVDIDIMLVPMESPVKVTSSIPGHFQAANLPREPNRSTILCENSIDQPFTWNTDGLSILSNHGFYKESLSVPGTLERRACVAELKKSSDENGVKLRHSGCSPQQRPFIIPFGNRPLSVGAQVPIEELGNVASLDSGVDIIVVPGKQEGCTFNKSELGLKQVHTRESCSPVTKQSLDAQKTTGTPFCDAEDLQEEKQLISHTEAARKLNGGNNGRTLWQKWEDRPLIGVN